MKKKILSIGIMLLFIGLTFSSINAKEVKEKAEEKITVQFASVDSRGKIFLDSAELSNSEVTKLQEILTNIMDKIKQSNGPLDLDDLLDGFFGNGNSIIYKIIKNILGLKLNKNSGFILSYGQNYKLNPFKKNSFDFKQNFKFWFYSPQATLIPGNTVIVRPLSFDVQVLTGCQMGFMNKFTGVYVYIAKKLPELSTTFFIGRANYIKAFDLPETLIPTT